MVASLQLQIDEDPENRRQVPDTASSLGDAAIFTGVPIAVVKMARSLGCMAFVRSGRIQIQALGAFLEAHHECWTMAGLDAPPKGWKATPSWDH